MHYAIVDIMKALACLLIVNFHSDIMYPENIRILAFGGDLGNNIFFLVSGFTLWPSIERSIQAGNGWQWFKKRFWRIFPMFFCFNMAMFLVARFRLETVSKFVSYFIFPTNYWFVTAIILFYVLLYAIEKLVNSETLRLMIPVLLAALHLIYNNDFAERYFVGFAAVLIGCELHRSNMLRRLAKLENSVFMVCTVAFAVVYCVLKLLRARGAELYGLIFLGVGIAAVSLSAAILLWGLIREKSLAQLCKKFPQAWQGVRWLSKVTLAVYLTNVFCDRLLTRLLLSKFRFPISYVLNLVITILIASVATMMNDHIGKKLRCEMARTSRK